MTRAPLILLALSLPLGCRTADKPPGGGQAAEGVRTGSPYSTGTDTTAMNQRIEGTNRGAGLQAPAQIQAVQTTLGALSDTAGGVTEANLTALRNAVSHMQDAMRSDFQRVGEADTGSFHTLADSLSLQLGGGPGGTANELGPSEVRQVSARIRRLIDVYQERMEDARQ